MIHAFKSNQYWFCPVGLESISPTKANTFWSCCFSNVIL